jgi:hypothetical protein
VPSIEKNRSRGKVHNALLSHCSLQADLLIFKALVKDRDSRVLKWVNLRVGMLVVERV